MPQVTITDETFERLQRHARPLVDTIDTVMNLALDALEKSSGLPGADTRMTNPERQIDPRNLPNLTHTKVLDASLEGDIIVKANWNSLLEHDRFRFVRILSC